MDFGTASTGIANTNHGDIMTINWDDFPNFSEGEFACRCGCGAAEMKEDAVNTFQELRTSYGRKLTVSSGYRCSGHPVEAKKIDAGGRPGSHYSGSAVDFHIAGQDAIDLLRIALNDPRVTGIGLQQKGPWNSRFCHIDTIKPGNDHNIGRPAIWTY
jgi:zinc D-Ala-D-Ala carboxypeptidase